MYDMLCTTSLISTSMQGSDRAAAWGT